MTDRSRPAPFDTRACTLGEGPLWHPLRGQLFWFDIIGRKLLTQENGAARDWGFPGHVSAAGWLGTDSLLIASETALLQFCLTSGKSTEITPLEAGNPATRSNDGRADPWGGFWIGTMGKALEPEAGAIWRYFRGEMRRMYDKITIPNAICFSPDGSWLYFADTPQQKIWRQALRGADGWPAAREPELFLDLRAEGLNPDGAVADSAGGLWNAQWGASRVARYRPDGRFDRAIAFAARQISCPAFGGADLATLFATSAAEGLAPGQDPSAGQTFAADAGIRGQAEYQVIL